VAIVDKAGLIEQPDDGHRECRIREFVRWGRLELEHEYTYISRQMAGSAFMSQELRDGLIHDLTDLSYLLAQLPPRIEVAMDRAKGRRWGSD
jgi:hypothetical protein